MSGLIDYIAGFDGYPFQEYLLENIDIIGYIASIYLVVVGKGDQILCWWNQRERRALHAAEMQNGVRKEVMRRLRTCYMAAYTYHLVMSIACAAAACILLPTMVQSILTKSFLEATCLWDDLRIYRGCVGLAMCTAVVVKIAQQLDTVFLVVRDYIVGPAAQEHHMRRVQPSHWWYHVLAALYFWHTFSVGTSCFTSIATLSMITSAIRNGVYMQQDAAQARENTAAAAAAASNNLLLVLDLIEWIGCSALSVYASLMHYTHERGCMTTQANIRMALVMYVTAIVLRLREVGEVGEDTKSTSAADTKKFQ